MASKTNKLIAEHHGKFHWGSLLKMLPPNLFDHALAEPNDPFGFGWTLTKQKARSPLVINGMLYATAEAVVALAAFSERLRSVDGNLKLTFGDGPQEWVTSLDLHQIAYNKWQPEDIGWTRPFDCYALPLRKITLTNREDVAARAQNIVQAIQQLPDNVLEPHKTQKLASIERVVYEALLNIYEHAYGDAPEKHLYFCATVTPTRHFDVENLEHGILTSIEEAKWFAENRDALMLEIAIADAGQGIPLTLWKNAREMKCGFANEWQEGVMDVNMRANAHQSLCNYAFHYASTRKRENEFINAASRLNWRGLHRSLQQTEFLSGTVALTSGQGRAGYVFVASGMEPIRQPSDSHTDFPGTLVTLRFSASQHLRHSFSAQGSVANLQLSVGKYIFVDELRSPISAEQITHSLLDRKTSKVAGSSGMKGMKIEPAALGTRVVAVYFPFVEITSAQNLLEILPALPPNAVAVLLFARIPPEVRAELRAYASDEWSSIVHGTPRIFCIWNTEKQGLTWQIAGELPSPQSGKKLYSDLEHLGHANLEGEGSETAELARELAVTYPECLVWENDKKALRFSSIEPTISTADYASTLALAFKSLIKGKQHFITECENDEAIRLPTGRLVKRFLSVLDMLRGNQVLVDALSQRLFNVLKEIGTPADICLVADSPASYFVATILLKAHPDSPRIHILQHAVAEGLGLNSTPVLFVDAMYRGETIKRLVAELQGISSLPPIVIACIDMRRIPVRKLTDTGCIVHGLITHYFDPLEFEPISTSRIIEIDSITHTPLSQVCEFTELADSEDARQFLNEHPEVFISGFHRVSGGQIHTVSLQTSMLVNDYQPFLVAQIVGHIMELIKDIPKGKKCRDFIIFCRPESRVYEVVMMVAEELTRQGNVKTTVLLANLRVAPTSPKPIFPRDEQDLLAELSDPRRQSNFFPIKTPSEFIGVYLDDAAATGSTLENFIVKASQLKNSRPLALLSIVMVNRLSPREVRFLNVCRELQQPQKSASSQSQLISVPFRFTSLFRLQVKAADSQDQHSVPELIREILKHRDYFDERLRGYAAALQMKLDSVFGPSAPSAKVKHVILHPFVPHEVPVLPLGVNAIHLRHLLALNEQNEGVVSEILRIVTVITKQHDYRLLTMLAVEPWLIKDDPLANHCWPAIKQLSLDCLSKNSSVNEKSDALVILCQRPDEFLQSLDAALPGITGNSDLMNQVATFLLSFSRHSRKWYEEVQTHLDIAKGRISVEELGWLRTILEVPERAETSYVVRDNAEAIARIHTLVATTWTHAAYLEEWQAFDSRVKRIVEEKEELTDRDSQLGSRCLDYAERILLSALAGIRYLGAQRLGPEDVNSVWRALIEGIRRVSELRNLFSSLNKSEPVWREEVGIAWNVLRRVTIKAASPIRFLGNVEAISADPSVIEEVLPRLYSAPYSLVMELATEVMPDLVIEGDQQVFFEDCILVPVARSWVHDFMRILLENMAKYGAPDGRRVIFSFVTVDGKAGLKIDFYNNKRDVNKGEGNGLRLLGEIARQGRFTFKPEFVDGEYHTCVMFPDGLRISPDILKE